MIRRHQWLGWLLVLGACDDDPKTSGGEDTSVTTAPDDTNVTPDGLPDDDTAVADPDVEPDVEPDAEPTAPDVEPDVPDVPDVPDEPDVPAPEPRVYDPVPGAWDHALDFTLPGLQATIGARAFALERAANGDIVIGGIFDHAGPVVARNVALYRDGAFEALGGGLDIQVQAVAIADDGAIVAAGRSAGGGFGVPSPAAVSVFRDGAWSPIGWIDGFSSIDYAGFHQGELYVAGAFSSIQSADYQETVEAASLARWDGEAWHAVVTIDGTVSTIVDHGPSLCIAGQFTTVDIFAAKNVACRGGDGWRGLGAGLNGAVYALHSDGLTLTAGGEFSFGDPLGPPGTFVVGLARFDSGAWSPLAGGVKDGAITAVHTILEDGFGRFVIGGNFDRVDARNPREAKNIAILQGDQWQVIGDLTNEVGTTNPPEVGPRALLLEDDALIVGGLFSSADGVTALNLAVYDSGGGSWRALGAAPAPGGIPGVLNEVAFGPDGALYVAGEFSGAGGVTTPRVAKLDTSGAKPIWQSLGQGLDNLAFVVLPARDGTVYAGGRFGVARFDADETAWHYPGVFAGEVFTLQEGPDGDANVYVGGHFSAIDGVPVSSIARFTGETYQPLGVGLNNQVNAIQHGPDGELYAGGMFTGTGDYHPDDGTGAPLAYLAKWTGAGWEQVGAGLDGPVRDLAWYDGELLVVGQFTKAGEIDVSSIARFDGESFHPIGVGDEFRYAWGGATPLLAVAVQENGFFLSGSMPDVRVDDAAPGHVVWWNGASFETLASGLDTFAESLAIAPDGRALWVGGPIAKAGGRTSFGLARWEFEDEVGVPITSDDDGQ